MLNKTCFLVFFCNLIMHFPIPIYAAGQMETNGVFSVWTSVDGMNSSDMDASIKHYREEVTSLRESIDHYLFGLKIALEQEVQSTNETAKVALAELDRVNREKELAELILQQRLLVQYEHKLDEIRKSVVHLSPNGLRQTVDLDEILSLLKSAEKLVVYGDAVPGEWNEDHSVYKAYIELPATITDSRLISELEILFRESEFKSNKEFSEIVRECGALATHRCFLIEVDEKAYIYIVGKNLIGCQNSKIYEATRFPDNEEKDFAKELAIILGESGGGTAQDSTLTTNPPPRGAAGSGGSEESDD